MLEELGGFDESVTRLVLDHHERLDGRGYPRGLKADDLDLATRILAVCDVHDALASNRVYRKAFSHETAVDILLTEAGTKFRPPVRVTLADLLAEQRAPVSVAV